MYGSFGEQLIQEFLYKIAVLYPAPINLNYLWNFSRFLVFKCICNKYINKN